MGKWLCAAALLLALLGCSQATQTGSLVISLSGREMEARTVVPDLDMVIDYYSVVGTGPGSGSFSHPHVDVDDAVVVESGLKAGPWYISVDAYNLAGTKIGHGEATPTVTPGAIAEAPIQVVPLSGNGTLDVEVSWLPGSMSAPTVQGSLTKVDETPVTLEDFVPGTNLAASTGNSLPAGYYLLTVQVLDGLVPEYGAFEAVRILAGQTTEVAVVVPSGAGGLDISITPDMQQPIVITFAGQQAQLQPGMDMTVVASTSEPVDSYQWYLNGVALAGETAASITIGSALAEGYYRLDLRVVKDGIASSAEWAFAVQGPGSWAKAYYPRYSYLSGSSLEAVPGGGYVLAGNGANRLWVARLDADRSLLWQKTFSGTTKGAASSNREDGADVAVTADGDFIVVGTTWYTPLVDADWWVVKLDSGGSVLWQYALGGDGIDRARSVDVTSDGGCVVAGELYDLSAVWTSYNDIGVVKLDADGTPVWQRIYGSAGIEDSAYSVSQTSDGGYIVSGGGDERCWLLKLASDGTVVWQKGYEGVSDVAIWNSVVQETAGGGFIVGTSVSRYPEDDCWLLRLDSEGSVVWQRSYAVAGRNITSSIFEAPGGGYVACGDTQADGWLLAVTGTGDPAWYRTYGRDGFDQPMAARAADDGGVVFVGTTDSFTPSGTSKAWIVKTAADGSCPPIDAAGTATATVTTAEAVVTDVEVVEEVVLTVTATAASASDTTVDVVDIAP